MKSDLVGQESWSGFEDLRSQALELLPLLTRLNSENSQFLLGVLHEIGVNGYDLCYVAYNQTKGKENHAVWEGRLIVQDSAQ